MSKFISFLKNEIVLIISFLLAVASAFFVAPDSEYIGYIDFRTLSLLFSLMTVMAGLNCLGIFSFVAEKLLKRIKSVSGLALVLVLICFFSSMLITNDVALITFVPFTVIALKIAGAERKLIYIVTLETIAANLGSMLTPIGNPQNLYLYSAFNIPITDFFKTILPYALVSLIFLVIFSCFTGKSLAACPAENNEKQINDKKLIGIYFALFMLAVLCVLRLIHFIIVLIAVLIIVLIFDRKTLKSVDYSLLLTFVFLFVFIGNLGRIEVVSRFLCEMVSGREVIVGILSSQIISNVPAAILLSGFTDNANALLIGVNIGGLGTLIASMASLISFKLVQKENVNSAKYLGVFTLLNIVFLVINITLWVFIK